MREQARKVSLDNVRTATPCAKGWDEMTGDDRVRFCDQCQLNVYNISAMERREAEAFLTNATGRVCGMYFRRADGTILTRDCPVGLRALRRKISRVAAAAFSAIFSLLTGNAALNATVLAQQGSAGNQVKIEKKLRRFDQPMIKGRLFDEFQAVIPEVKVTATNSKTGKTISTETDGNGDFRFADLPEGNYTIKAASLGFRLLEVTKLQLADGESLELKLTLKVNAIMGDITVINPEPLPTKNEVIKGDLQKRN